MKKSLATILIAFASYQLTAQIPILNSYPSNGPVIYLDFDGHTVSNTSLNYNGPFVCNSATLSNSQIIEIFERVAEDYRPFTVNITTDSSKYLASPLTRRMRVIITTSYEWYGSAGGVAFIGSFSWGNDTPCFVFSSLLNNNTKKISEAVSHEAGHTLGLYHQSSYDNACALISDYNYGYGTGETGWAPIMGVGYYQNLTTWHNGPNSYGCTSMQNDRAIIASTTNGITIKSDDNRNTTSGAASIIISNNSFAATGTFEQINDEDLFKLKLTTQSQVKISAKPQNVGNQNAGANSDILVGLYTQKLKLITTNNLTDSLHATIDTVLNAGTYYIRLKPVANTFATTYGMSGRYIINGTLTNPAAPQTPLRLELSGEAIDTKHQLRWEVDTDEEIKETMLEYSYNGSTFSQLSGSKAASGLYPYTPPAGQTLTYRCRVTFKNGETHYSKPISIQPKYKDEPQILSNPVTNGTITVTNSNRNKYILLDMQGKSIKSGVLSDETTFIPFQTSAKGMYVIKFISIEGNVSTKKIIVQ